MNSNLYNVGHLLTNDQIDGSLKRKLEEIKIEIDDKSYIKFENVRFEAKKEAENSSSIKDAVINQKSILTKIYADVVKYTGSAKKTAVKDLIIGHVPQLLEGRNSFIVNGTEYNVVNQLRRNPASYVTMDSNSNIFADFNLAKGRNFHITLDPVSNKFYVEIGTSRIILKTLLHALDVYPQEFKSAVGDKLYAVNWNDVSQVELERNYYKLYSKLFEFRNERVKELPLSHVMKEVKDYYINNTKVDPRTTKYLYDTESSRVDKQLVLETLRKYKNVIDDEDDPVDVDDLYYQRLYTPNLLFVDRVDKLLPELKNKIRFKLKDEGRLDSTFKNFFSKPLVSLVNSSNLSRLDPQYNPLGIYSSGTTVTPLGMGGINDITAVRKGSRGVHNSHMGVIDPIASPQGQNVGIQLKLTDDVKVNEEGLIHIPLKDKKGKEAHMFIGDTFTKKILLPNQDLNGKEIFVLHRGNIVPAKDKNDWDYEFARGGESLLNDIDKLIPMANAVQGNRNYMSFRFFTQALPLLYKQKPNVVNVNSDGESTYRSLRRKLEKFIPLTSPVSGTVYKIRDNKIVIKDGKGEQHEVSYHKHLPLATNTGLHQRPTVRVGDTVKKGDIILKDPYTSNDGELAIGVNLKTAFTPYYGSNSEDAVVISESAAKKLTSVHYYTYTLSIDDSKIVDKKQFTSLFSNKYTQEQLDKLDDGGVIKSNLPVNYGDPLIACIQKKSPDDKLSKIGNISKKIIIDLKDGSELYDKHTIGEVIEVQRSGKLVTVIVKTFEPATIGDKISASYGNKGIISSIIPDTSMLQDEEGKPIDSVWSSTVVVSRINPAQIYENSLGKIVRKAGRERYEMPILSNPDGKPLYKYVADELKKYKIKDKETVFDPVAGKAIDNPVAVGNMYTLKLLKGDKDLTARGVGPFYTSNLTPAKGGKEGAKSVGMGEFYGLIGHNARHTLSEMSSIKSQYNPEFFKNFELGLTTPVNKDSFTWDKTKAMLTAAGGYIEQTPSGHVITPLTDKLTNELAKHRVIQTPALLKSKSLEPVKKGLFDKDIVGGLDGKLWSKIELNDGIVSPLVSDYVRLTMGMNKEEFDKWQTESDTKKMKKDLSGIDIDKTIADLRSRAKTNDLNNNEMKVYKFLSNIKDKDMKLNDLVITSIPVPPPVYRPITQLESGDIQLADINNFYKDVMLANEGLEGLEGSSFKNEAKATLIDNVNALIGKTDTHNVQLLRKGAKGILSYIGGVGTPKNSFIHSTMIKKNQDMSGRARIIPDAKMDMDTIGIPETMAWKLYTPHIRKSLISGGYSSSEADTMIEKHDATARQHLMKVLEKTPVWYNRAPTLSRHGFLVGKPVLVPGNSININMFSTGPLNADFDGDAIQLHVPLTEKASREADKFLLSKIVFDDSDIDTFADVKLPVESVLGFYQMSLRDAKKLKSDIDNITKPAKMEIGIPFNKKAINKVLLSIAKDYPDKVNEWFTKLKALGEDYATHIGSTVGIDDVTPDEDGVKSILKVYKPKIKAAKDTETRVKLLEALQKEMISLAGKHTGNLADMVRSGAKGSDNQLASMLTSPTIAYDPDRPFHTATLAEGNFASGLGIRDFWNLNAKARKDLVNTALAVATPGALNKLIIASVNKEVISEEDCGTQRGIEMPSDSRDIYGRVLAINSGKLKRGDVITADNASKLAAGMVTVRSPQTCESVNGVCQKCFGVDSLGKFYDIGINVGVRAAHSISKPLTQMSLDSKHGGRAISRDVGGGGLSDMLKLFSSDEDKPEIALISEDDGYIESITELPNGNFDIVTDTGLHYVAHRKAKILVKAGDSIEKGDKLTEGVIPFTKMVELKGIRAGRQALTNEANRILGANGKRVHPRLTELVGKAAVNYIEFMTPWETWDIGDIINYNQFAGVCNEKGVDMPINILEEGMFLAEEVLDYSCGHQLTASDVTKIKGTGKKNIKVLPTSVRVRPVVRSLYTAGLADDDWLNHVGLRYIKKDLIDATALGNESNDESFSPMVKWIKGRPFSTDSATY